ncbi:4-hydroxy-tetrahydrodipicolinate reductase [Candidatus Sororendozoicomonas aggregata]|uniref:4-hydroxy-tetrahydrodipicolinate reductase n=1 Tax=Candidatus Sororendozoicomonas aggregata TaxID=3073239 RepID=UPI002ED10B0C
MIKVGIAGAAGRMGRMLVEAIAADDKTVLSAAIVSPGSSLLGVDAGELAGGNNLGVPLTGSLSDSIHQVDTVIDFTHPEFTMANAALCAEHGKSMVIGTTGFSAEQQQTLKILSEQSPMVVAPNMSIGVNLVFKLLETAARVMGLDADVEVLETHHRNKVDSPSGTALKMGEVVAKATGRDLGQWAIYGREGNTGVRERETIGFATVRAGDVIGDHTVLFACEGERIEITHKASDRMIYARGSVRAVAFLQGKKSGFYDMQDVLGIRDC